jgi:hypothetical protein
VPRSLEISASEILHFDKSGLGFLDILFLVKEEGHTCERREKDNHMCERKV